MKKINAIVKNDTCDIATFLKGHKVIVVKWVYEKRRIKKEKLKGTRQD